MFKKGFCRIFALRPINKKFSTQFWNTTLKINFLFINYYEIKTFLYKSINRVIINLKVIPELFEILQFLNKPKTNQIQHYIRKTTRTF